MSDEPRLDLTRSRAGVPPGNYYVRVEDVDATVSPNFKFPMLHIWFTILEGDHSGQTVTDRFVLSEDSMHKVEPFLQAVDLPLRKDTLELDILLFVGRALQIEVADGEPYNGRARPTVRAYRRVDPAP